MNKMMEVRCCCVPQNLLGWLPAPTVKFSGRTMNFPLPDGEVLTLPMSRYIERVHGEVVTDLIAYKSQETPIETLRLIPNFVENK